MPDDVASRSARIEELLSNIGNFGSKDPAGSAIRALLETIWKVSDRGLYETLPSDLDFLQHSVDHYQRADANKDDHLRSSVYALAEAMKLMLATLSEKNAKTTCISTAEVQTDHAVDDVQVEEEQPSASLTLPPTALDLEMKEEDLFVPGDPAYHYNPSYNPTAPSIHSGASEIGSQIYAAREEENPELAKLLAGSSTELSEASGDQRESQEALYSSDEDFEEQEATKEEEWLPPTKTRKRTKRSADQLICANCGTKEAVSWRRNDEGEQECHNCRQHFQKYGVSRPKERNKKLHRKTIGGVCSNCETTESTCWRRNQHGEVECNQCRLWFQRKGTVRPKELGNAIRRRSRNPRDSSKGEEEMEE